jgi:oxygen-independent coproporphyrinogen-3 oxidase
LIDPGALAGLLSEMPGEWQEGTCQETTLEAAPGGITPERAAAWRRAGINRVSLGVQSFNTRELARTGRKHTAEVVEHEIGVLRAAGIGNFNVDLIAGLPGQTLESWNHSLDWAVRLNAPHVSVYMLEVDEDSRLGAEVMAFGKRYGAPDIPSDDQIADFYEIAVEHLACAGIARYEISNFARPGFESRHNLKYWRREPYLGFGADAHSFDGAWRWQNPESIEDYLCGSKPERTPADPTGERLFLGLRLTEGVTSVNPGDWSPFQPAIERLIRDGLLESDKTALRLTSRGVLLSNEVFSEFV